MSHFPVFLDLRGRRCVVLGAGALAEEKAAALRAAGAVVEHWSRPFRGGDLRGAFLAIEASGDPAAQEAARREADRHRVLLNVVDVAAKCDWIAPAVVRRGPLQIAVSTAGESPFVAATIRARLESLFGEEWGPFTQVVGTVRRRLRRRGVAPERQRAAYRRLLRSPVRRLLREGRYRDAAAAAAAVEARACDDAAPAPMGEVVLVGAGPGDPGLLTVAGREALQQADVVFHDALVDQSVLDLCPPSARVVPVGKRGGHASAAQADINEMLAAAARSGACAVRLKGGDPMLFARGGEEIEALTAAGIPVRVIPGVSAALAAPAAAGIALTHRGVAASVAIVTGRQADGTLDHLARIATTADTLIVLMPMDLDAIATRLARVLGPDRSAAVISGASLDQERVVRAPLGEIAAAVETHQAPARPAGGAPRTLIVGDVVARAASAAARTPRHPAATPVDITPA